MAIAIAPINAQPIDISDTALFSVLGNPFQYDFTLVQSDSTLRPLLEALDLRMAMIEYRQRVEYLGLADSGTQKQNQGRELESQYRMLLGEGMTGKTLENWRFASKDPINRAFIREFLSRRDEMTADPELPKKARELATRIADRLYRFHFFANDSLYSASRAAWEVASGVNPDLARTLYRLQNDSAALLAEDAALLYELYFRIGQSRGYKHSFAFNTAQLSFRQPEWVKIAQEYKKATDSEFSRCLETVTERLGRKRPLQIELERSISAQAVLPDSFFTPERSEAAIKALMSRLGLDSLFERLTVQAIDSGTFPALAVRLDPPYKTMLVTNRSGGFNYYRRLAAETGRALVWVFADSTLPWLLRNNPNGADEALTGLFSSLALDPDFLAEQFQIPQDQLNEFKQYDRWQTIFRLRRTLVYFLLDYYLSEEEGHRPTRDFWSLEYSLLGTPDSSFQWIESLVTGELQKYPARLASHYCRYKLEEILFSQFGEGYRSDRRVGRFLIEKFCRPGKSQTLEQFFAAHSRDRLDITDIRRVLELR